MNLYDSSRENNFELALAIDARSDVQLIKRQVIDAELLVAEPAYYRPGAHTAATGELRKRMLQFCREMTEKGFCVLCGAKMDLDYRSGYHRCRACFIRTADTDPTVVRTSFCHYCGGKHASIVPAPFHHGCEQALREYRDWERLNFIPQAG
jgi:hypothetical protein